MIWNEILCLGDSITFGARDPYKRSYPNELGQMLTEKTKEFYCFSRNSARSSKLKSSFFYLIFKSVKSQEYFVHEETI